MSLAPGVRLGAYEILSLIGAGGMGEVYRARDTRLGRAVAIKVLPAAVSEDDSARQRLFREARAISSLDHPNVCALYDVGHEGGIDYLVMQYLEGETLAALLHKGPLPVEIALRYASEIGEALVAAHARGIVHRDLKPANVMITSAGARLLDFGLAIPPQHLDPESGTYVGAGEATQTVTGPGRVLGTLPYMAPEQLEGSAADARSDIFSFGAVLYEMLTGRRPFIATPQAGVMTQILATTPPPPSRINPKVTRALDQVVARCLAKTPAERWQTARAVLNALTVAVNESREPDPMRKWAYAAAAAALAIIIAGGWPYLVKTVPAVNPAATRTAESTTLVILPFDVESADPSERAFWNGLSQAVTAKLAQLPAASRLQVASAADVAARKVRSVAEARIELGATRVIRGRTNNDNGTTIELFDARTGAPVRAKAISTDRRDPAALQNAVLDGIVSLLDVALTARDRAKLATPQATPGAYDLYLQGISYLQDDGNPKNVETSVALFTRALELDADHAPAYAGLGLAYWRKYVLTREVRWVEEARRSCERALGLMEDDPSPHMCLGTVEQGTGRYEKAIDEFRHVIAIEPDDEAAYIGLAQAFRALGETVRAEENYQRAIALRPSYWVGYSRLGEFYFALGRYPEAEKAFTNVVTLSPDSWRGYSNLGATLYAQERYADAIAALQKSMAIRPNYQAASNLGTIYFFGQVDYAKAAEAFQAALAIRSTEYVVWGNFAWALHWSGEAERARAAFAKAASLAEARRTINKRDPAVLMALAEYYAALGDVGRAQPIVKEALVIAPDNPRVMYQAGVFYEYFVRDRQQATHWLQAAVRRGYPWKEVEREPGLERFRSDGGLRDLRRFIPSKPT